MAPAPEGNNTRPQQQARRRLTGLEIFDAMNHVDSRIALPMVEAADAAAAARYGFLRARAERRMEELREARAEHVERVRLQFVEAGYVERTGVDGELHRKAARCMEELLAILKEYRRLGRVRSIYYE